MTARPSGMSRSTWFHLPQEFRCGWKQRWAKWMDIGMEGITEPTRPHFTLTIVDEEPKL